METLDQTNEMNKPEKGAMDASNLEQNSVLESMKSVDNANEAVIDPLVKEPLNEAIHGDSNTSFVKEKNTDQKAIPEEDYSTLTKMELITRMNELFRHYDIEQAKDHIEDLRINFYKKYSSEIDAQKAKFIEEGGAEEDFQFSGDSEEETFKVLYEQYKKKRNELNQKQEEAKQENLKVKLHIIDEIRELINKEESINKTFQEFRDLQQKWREVGLVPQSELKSLWDNYNHAVESFYDYIKINKELRDLDLKKNFEDKIDLCEKAEALLLEESVTKAFKVLQDYHIKWREIGPVPRDQKDDIWERFKAATTQINKKHQEFFEGLKDQQVKNLEQKTALCEKVEEILNAEVQKPKDWEDRAEEVIEIQKLWRTIGFAPKKDNNKIYSRFKIACDEFFAKKRDFYKETKDEQKNNLQLKLDLCVQAEALKDNEEWKKTTEDFIKLQKRWKEIGPVPKKHSDALWKRFRTACDSFFNKKTTFFSTVDSRQEDNLKLKMELIAKVKAFIKPSDDKEALQVLMDLQKQWTEIGHVPLNKKDDITKDFREAINAQFEKLKIESDERNRITFKTKVDGWVANNSTGKLYSERNKLITKIRELENEIALYENNIGFFSKSRNSDSMVHDIEKKIEKAKERMEALKEKLQLLDSADDE